MVSDPYAANTSIREHPLHVFADERSPFLRRGHDPRDAQPLDRVRSRHHFAIDFEWLKAFVGMHVGVPADHIKPELLQRGRESEGPESANVDGVLAVPTVRVYHQLPEPPPRLGKCAKASQIHPSVSEQGHNDGHAFQAADVPEDLDGVKVVYDRRLVLRPG